MTGLVRAECLRMLRAPAAARAAVYGTTALACVLWFAWPTGATPAGARAYVSGQVLAILLAAQVVAVGIIAPVLGAGTVAGERERKTLDLLRTVPIGRGTLVAGKIAATAALVVFLVAAALPLWGACLLLGAVRPEQVAGGALVLLGEALAFSAAGVWASVRMRRTLGAALVGMAVASPGVIASVAAAASVAGPTGQAIATGAVWLALGAGIAVWFAGLAAARLRRPVEEAVPRTPRFEEEGEQARVARAIVGLRHDRFPDRLLLSPARGWRPGRGWPEEGNAFFHRETTADVSGAGGAAIRFTLFAGFLLVLPLTCGVARTPEGWIAALIGTAGALGAAAAAAQALPSERDRKTLDLLRVVPRSDRDVPWGKALAAARLGVGLSLCLTLVALPALILHGLLLSLKFPGAGSALALGAEAAIAAACVLSGLGAGVLAGAVFRSSGAALVAAFAMLGGLLLAPLVGAAFLPFLGTEGRAIANFLALLSPYRAIGSSYPGSWRFGDADLRLDVAGLLSCALVLGGAGLAMVVSGLAVARRRLAG
ncbi:MAG: ABC transporter permease [Planctomycetales bacterium]|nr:ABC transporter permease [Planctomycetales bacterium]